MAQVAEYIDRPRIGARKLHRLGYDGFEHRLEIQRRINRLANLAERLQLANGFCKLACPRLHLVEQPHVFDRDHRLVGEGREELDLFVRERINAASCYLEGADRRALPKERNAKH